MKLNTDNPAVRAHLFAAVRHWVEAFGIDGLRLDAAGALDSVTNYELYKGLYSSHNDGNYFEVAYALNRQSGPDGIYRDLALYTFADNHDVNRVASNLANPAHLYPLHALLFTAPGIPSIYYGSEYGVEGRRRHTSDLQLRPEVNPTCLARTAPHPQPRDVIARLIRLRRDHPALRQGSYRQLHVAHEQVAYLRATPNEQLVVAVNAADKAADVKIALPGARRARLVDVLDTGGAVPMEDGSAMLRVPSRWARVLRVESNR